MVDRRPDDIGYDDPDEITAETAIPEPETLTVPDLDEEGPEAGPEPEAKAEPEEALVIPPAPKRPKVVRQKDLEKAAAPVDEGEGFDDPDAISAPEKPSGVAAEGSFIPEAGKAVAAGATEATGGMIKGLGGIRVEAMQTRLEEEARAAEVAKMQKEGIMPEGSVLAGGIVNLQNLPEAQRKAIQDRLAAATSRVEQIDLANDPFFKAGLATNEWSEKHFAAAKDYEDSWTRSIGEGLGSIAPYLVAGAVPGVGTVAGLGAGWAGSTGEAIDRAIKAGATKEQLLEAVRLGGIPGLGEQISADVLLEKVPLPVMGKVLGALAKIAGKAMAEGGQEGLSQTMQNVIEKYVYDPNQDILEGVAEAAGMGAIVGGIVAAPTTRADKAKEDIEDEETVDEAGDAQPKEGVAEPEPEAVQNPPGGLGEPPKPPANTGAVAEPEETPAAVPAAGVDPDVGAALGATPAAKPAPTRGRKKAPVVTPTPVAEPELEEDVSGEIAEQISAGTEEQLAATEARMRDLFKDETRQQEQAASRTKAAPANADVNAALAASTPKPPMKETLGTGQAVNIPAPAPAATAAEQPVPGQPAPPAAAQAQEPGAPPPLAPAGPEEALRSRLSPEENAKLDQLRAEPVAAFQAAEPAPPPVLAPEPVAEPEPALVEAAPEPAPAPEPTRFRYADLSKEEDAIAPAKNKLRKLTREVSDEEYDFLKENVPNFPTAAETAMTQKQVFDAELEWKKALARRRKETEAAVAAEAGEIKRKEKLAAIEEKRAAAKKPAGKPAEAQEPPKAKAVKAKAKAKQAPSAEPAAPVAAKGEQYKIIRKGELEAEEAARQETSERAKQKDVAEALERTAAEEARQAERKPLARQAEKKAHEVLNRTSTVTEIEGTYQRVLEEVSDAVAARIPEGAPPKAALYKATEAIVTGVKRRMAQLQEEADVERMKGADVAKAEQLTKQKEEEKQRKLVEGTGQQKSRGEKKKGGAIRTEGPKATRSAAEKNPSDPLLQAWMALDAAEQEIPDKRSSDYKDHAEEYDARLADIANKKKQINEGRAMLREKEEAEAAENAPMSDRALKVQAQAEAAIAANPLPREAVGKKAQIEAAKQHLAKFVRDTRKINVAGRPDRKANSSAENLIIYARKLEGQKNVAAEAEIGAINSRSQHALEFVMAQFYQQSNAMEDFYALTLNEKIKGGQYNEEVGEDESGGSLKALHEDETDVRKRDVNIHEETEVYDITGGKAHARVPGVRKGGRAAQQARTMSLLEREERGAVGHTYVKMQDEQGNMHRVPAEVVKASSALRELNATTAAGMAGEGNYEILNQWGGYVSVLRSTLTKHLIDLVGDVDVIFIPQEAMTRTFGEAAGIYLNFSDAERAAGKKPMIFMDERLRAEHEFGESADYAHTLVHELVHAATVQGYYHNIRGTQPIIDKMKAHLETFLRKHYTEEQLKERNVAYGFTDSLEFIAEAFSNPDFQYLLANYEVPAAIRREIQALKLGRAPTWFEAVSAAVSNAIGFAMGSRGNTYMETMVALYPSIVRTSVAQTRAAQEEVNFARLNANRHLPKADRAAGPRNPGDVHALNKEFSDRLDGMRGKAGNLFTMSGARTNDLFSTTGQLMRRAEKFFGSLDNPFNKLARLLLAKDPLRAKYRALGADLEIKLLQMQKTNKKMYKKLSLFLHEASRFKIDPTKPLSDPANKKAKGKGARAVQRQAMHAKMAAEWNALPADVRATGQEVIQHYADMHEREGTALVKYTIQQAIRKYRLAAVDEATVDKMVDWVRSGRAAENKGTQEDIDFRKALGKSADTIAAVKELRKIDGIYVPLTRRGKYFISATVKPYGTLSATKNLPAGATADASQAPTAEDPDPIVDRLLFKDRASLDAFSASSSEMVNVGTIYIDPKTGKTVTKDFQVADKSVPGGIRFSKPVYVATIQNKYMEMSDNLNALEKQRKEMLAKGHKVAKVRMTREMMAAGATDITSPQLQRLMNNLGQTTLGKTTIGQQALEAALIDAHIRSLTTPGVLSRKLRREGTMGYDLDLAGAAREYNQNAASHLANIELAPQYAEAEAELQSYIDKSAYAKDNVSVRRLQVMQAELNKRILSPANGDKGDGFWSRAANTLMDVSYLRHLFSPHYSIIQMLQPFMTTGPVLGSKYGHGAAWKEIVKAYRIGGISKTLGKGFAETWHAGRNMNPYAIARIAHENGIGVHDALWVDMVKNEKDASFLQDVFAEIRELGFGAASGIEASALAEADLTAAEIAINRLSAVAKGIPEAAEGINRYVTAIATYRLERRMGSTHEEAKRHAVLAVEQTQGGYSRANNPTFAQNPFLRLPLQFKKYGLMYGQMFYGNLYTSLNFKEDRQTQVRAAKTWISMAAMTWVFAGVGGLPFIELARILINMALWAGLEDDDWETHEAGMESWFNDMAAWATGDEGIGDRLGEAAMHGLTRLAGISTSNSLGADNLITFGQPKTMDEEGVATWLFKATVLGAGGSMMWDTAKQIHNAETASDYAGALPWPKIIDNMRKAWGLYSEGTVSKTTGEEFAPPVSMPEAAVKLLGFQPASEARQWEVKGGGTLSKEKRGLSRERTALMQRWVHNPDDRDEIMDEIREFNQEHPDDRITRGGLIKSKKTSKERKREREKELEAR